MNELLLLTLIVSFSHFTIDTGTEKKVLSPCDFFGKIQVTKIKKQADAIIFIEESEFSSELRVYEEENILMANLPGIWHIVSETDLHFPDYKIYYTNIQHEADFSVFFVSNAVNAGCDNE